LQRPHRDAEQFGEAALSFGRGRRVLAALHRFLANPADERTIHLQGHNRGRAGRGQTEDFNACPAEVLMPEVTAWAEERRVLSR